MGGRYSQYCMKVQRITANMGLLSVDHPDILKFIDCKNDLTQFTNFNISVGITDEFMKAVEAGTDYALYDPHTGEELERLDAREVFDKIATNAWKTGEPGIMFLDEVNRHNPVPNEGRIEATNPCGEQPLHANASCNLGSLNLTMFVKDGELDWKAFEKAIRSAIHFLDNVIEVNKYPLKIIEKTTKKTRNIGLGIMGFADMLFMLGIPYNTQEARDLGEKIMGFITDCGMEESKKLAKKRGTFPAYEGSVWESKNMPLRNATITTLAPTGSISVMAGCSSGMEPIFALAFTRNILDGAHLTEVNPVLKERLHEVGLDTEEMFERIAREGTLQNIEEIPDEIKRVFVCAPDISPRDHVLMQAAFQKRTHNAISKTVNLPNSATVADVKEVYMTAYRTGCKGTTIYRDGSRDTQVLTTGTFDKKDEDEKKEEVKTEPTRVKPRPRPDSVYGVTEKMPVGCGNLYTTVNFDEQGICEIFTNTGKHGGCPSQSEATARLASLALRCGVAVEDIVAQLKGIRCPSTIRRPGMKCLSCPDAMARIIEREWEKEKDKMEQTIVLYDEESEPEEETLVSEPSENTICPECGNATLYHESGCVLCTECGYSKCG